MDHKEVAQRIVKRFVDEASKEAMLSNDPEYLARLLARSDILQSRIYNEFLVDIITEELDRFYPR